MSNRYRATVNVQAPLTLPTTMRANWAANVLDALAATVNRHMILERHGMIGNLSAGVASFYFVYEAAGDGEAVSIVHDAAREAGQSYDAVRVTANGGRRKVDA